MAKKKGRGGGDDKHVISYRHAEKRTNNPEVGMVTPDSDPHVAETRWTYDPHIDPALQFDVGRAQVERLIDDALASRDEKQMRAALEQLKREAQPYLNWTGKAERTSFAVDTVSLHVHERIDPATILTALKKRLKDGKVKEGATQGDFFRAWFEQPLPLHKAVEFYKHDRGWMNRLIAGDSLLVMNSLLQKEGMAGQVQMIYIDPPYGIKYGSNFQPFVNKRDVKDRKDEDLTQEPEMIKAFRDTWELGIHSYLTYLRDRLLLARELLHESGSVFVQISDENIHRVRGILDEVFGADNFCASITFAKTSGRTPTLIAQVSDYLLWYGKDKKETKYRQIFEPRPPIENPYERYICVETSEGKVIDLSLAQKLGQGTIPEGRLLRLQQASSQGETPADRQNPVLFQGRPYTPPLGRHWSVTYVGMTQAAKAGRTFSVGKTLTWKSYRDEFAFRAASDNWTEGIASSGFGDERVYVVQTTLGVIQRCLLMATDPGDLVLDPTCGSGTTAAVAEKWGRRWITCDTSRVAVTLAKQRLMTSSYEYYELKYPHEGLKGGFIYQTVPHVTLSSIADNPEVDEIYERMHPAIDKALSDLNKAAGKKLKEWEVLFDFPDDWDKKARKSFDEFHATRQAMQKAMDASIAAHADQETLYDKPAVAKDKLRITGPFTVEAVPFPTVLSLDESRPAEEADVAIARSGESARQHGWRDELLKTGIRGKGGQMLRFAELETLPDTRYLHCSGTVAETGERVVVSFGPEHAALEQRQVAQALNEAEKLRPAPKFIIFCAFTFDPEAAKDIDETKWPGVTLLKAQMNTDLLTEDLKKARASNQSFWLMGQPDVQLRKVKDGQYQIEVMGFDYFDPAKGELVSGGKGKIAAWMLDTDYDERSLFPRQVFFPMAGDKDGWNKLKKDIKAELDESRLEQFHGTVSLPFAAGENRKAAVKIVDDRGIESLKIIPLD